MQAICKMQFLVRIPTLVLMAPFIVTTPTKKFQRKLDKFAWSCNCSPMDFPRWLANNFKIKHPWFYL